MNKDYIIKDLQKENCEQKDVIEELNKLLLDSNTEKNRISRELKHLGRELFYLEHEVRTLKAKLSKFT